MFSTLPRGRMGSCAWPGLWLDNGDCGAAAPDAGWEAAEAAAAAAGVGFAAAGGRWISASRSAKAACRGSVAREIAWRKAAFGRICMVITNKTPGLNEI
jgi:hypothetical protein